MYYNTSFFDLDGTLIKFSRKVSEENLKALKLYSNLKGQIVISTGRWPISAIKINSLIENYCENKNRYLISLNGAIIYDLVESKIIYQSIISHHIFEKLIEFRKRHHLGMWVYTLEGIKNKFIYTIRIPFKRIVSLFNSGKLLKIKQTNSSHFNVLKILFLSLSKKKIEKSYLWLKENLEPYLQITKTSPHNIEITHSNTNKGSSVDIVCKMLNVDKERTVAFGDSGNDLPMFEKTGICISINSKNSQVLSKATYVVNSKHNNAVALGLVKYVINNPKNFKKNQSNILIDISYLDLPKLNSEIHEVPNLQEFFRWKGNLLLISSEQINDLNRKFKFAFNNPRIPFILGLNSCVIYSLKEKKYLFSKSFSDTQVDALVEIYRDLMRSNTYVVLVFYATNLINYVVSHSYMDYEMFLKKHDLRNEEYHYIEFNDLIKKHLQKIAQIRIFNLEEKSKLFNKFKVRYRSDFIDLNPDEGFVHEIADIQKVLKVDGNYFNLNAHANYKNAKNKEVELSISLNESIKKILLA